MYGRRVIATSLLSWILLAACGGSPAASPGYRSAAPSPPPVEICVQPDDQATQTGFRSMKGEQLWGVTLGSGSVGVVLSHQFMSDLCEWLPEAMRLRDLGYRVLAFDFGIDLVADVEGATAEIRREGASKVVLAGASMGGAASIAAAAAIEPAVAGVASLSGPAFYRGVDALSAAKQLQLPILFMDASDSKSFPQDARAMYAACPSQHKQLVLLPGTDHGTELLDYAVAIQARAVLEQFIADATAG